MNSMGRTYFTAETGTRYCKDVLEPTAILLEGPSVKRQTRRATEDLMDGLERWRQAAGETKNQLGFECPPVKQG